MVRFGWTYHSPAKPPGKRRASPGLGASTDVVSGGDIESRLAAERSGVAGLGPQSALKVPGRRQPVTASSASTSRRGRRAMDRTGRGTPRRSSRWAGRSVANRLLLLLV